MVRKSLWLATNFAGKMIRENGYYNKAITIAANYYNENENDIKEQLRLRQSNGQKTRAKGIYKYYVFDGDINTYYNDLYEVHSDVLFFKATNSENAKKQINTQYIEKGRVRKRNNIETGKFITDEEWIKNVVEFTDKVQAEDHYLQLLKTKKKEFIELDAKL